MMNIIKKILGIKDISKEFEVNHVPSAKRITIEQLKEKSVVGTPPVSTIPKEVYQKYTAKLTKEDEKMCSAILKLKKSGSTKQEVIKLVGNSKINNRNRVLELVEMVFSEK